jgi:serine/threonine protein kinase
MTPRQFGRFEILRTLGSGGQGAVYLARDPQLERQVAIKTLRRAGQSAEPLLKEARIASRLQHANIVALHDAGEQQGQPYLVYAYVEGETLAQALKSRRVLPPGEAARVISGVLDGLACAHAQGVIHLDVKPANIMLTPAGVPMVMDFGLAQRTHEAGAKPWALSGSPRYVAPELIDGQRGTPLADVYAAGAVLYEMLTGEQAVKGDNLYAVLNRAANARIAAPSQANAGIDERLEAIVLKAVARDPNVRYANAADMKAALAEYLEGAAEESAGASNSTLDFLLRRMRTKKDFPALSGSIAEINRIVSSADASNGLLASCILKDFSLTSKLLKLVNAATYGQYGGSINTVSKAVVILGFETVRSIASSLIFIEFLQNKSQAGQVKDEVTHAIFTSIVAAQLSVGQKIRDAEEVMVCAMFHGLGRMLAAYYFHDESRDIAHRVAQGESEAQAALKVLGITYPELGAGVARSWNFSPRLIAGMGKLDTVKPVKGELDTLTAVVNIANEMCDSLKTGKAAVRERLFAELIKRYAPAIKVTDKQLGKALDAGVAEFARRSTMLGITPGRMPLLDRLSTTCVAGEAARPAVDDPLHGAGRLEQTLMPAPGEPPDAGGERPANPELVLGEGIQDVTNSLVGEFRLNDVLQMILETIYRGMGFHRALLLIRDNRQNAMLARCGFGPGIEALMPEFRFSLDYVPDVFHVAVARGVDIAIEDTQAVNIADKIPAWYRDRIGAPCFLLLPAMVKERAICMFYADMGKPGGLNTSAQQLALLRTLRNQAVLAIKQKM